jgi:hypothetical protein
MNPPKYFLYARKSTDEDDRQILPAPSVLEGPALSSVEGSIESQLIGTPPIGSGRRAELREFAQKERLTIAQEFTESMSAKVPGRPSDAIHQKRFFANACPDPDFRYRSNSMARRSSWKGSRPRQCLRCCSN